MPAEATHPHPTSQAAQAQIRPQMPELRQRVLAFLEVCGAHGATDEEVQTALRMNPSTERPRRVELLARGLVCASGQTRPTRSGRQAVVWIASTHRPALSEGA
jgi:hypothetical protein